MIQKIQKHVDTIFAPYDNEYDTTDIRKELTQNLREKYIDYKERGYSEQEAYDVTIHSIGNVEEIIVSIDSDYKKDTKRDGVLPASNSGLSKWISNGAMAAIVYAILFIAFMLVFNQTLTRDWIVMPALALFVIVSIVQYVVKGNDTYPRWLVIGSFVTSVMTAGMMTFIHTSYM